MRAIVVGSFVVVLALSSGVAKCCEPTEVRDAPGQQATNVYWQFFAADAVVLADPLSSERYAVDGNYSGLEITFKVAKIYKGPLTVGALVKVDAFNACVAPRKPNQQVLVFLCGKPGRTMKYCVRSEDWRVEVPGDRALVEQIGGRLP